MLENVIPNPALLETSTPSSGLKAPRQTSHSQFSHASAQSVDLSRGIGLCSVTKFHTYTPKGIMENEQGREKMEAKLTSAPGQILSWEE